MLLTYPHDLLCQYWDEGAMSQGMRVAIIITLYKNNGDRRDCNTYAGISLISTVGKVFVRIILNRLHVMSSMHTRDHMD